MQATSMVRCAGLTIDAGHINDEMPGLTIDAGHIDDEMPGIAIDAGYIDGEMRRYRDRCWSHRR
jgi:hypothetical protein